MLRRDRDLFEDSLLTYASGLSPDSGSGAVRRLRPFGRREAQPRVSFRGAAVRFLSVVAFTVLTHSPVAAWLGGGRARQRGDVSNWFIFDCSTDVLVAKMSEPQITLIFVMGCDGVLVVGLVAVMGVWRFGWCAAPRRPGHPPLASLRSRAPPYAARRGRLLLDCLVFGGGLVGRAGLKPGPTFGGCIVGKGWVLLRWWRGVVVWLVCGPSPPRTSPARIAALARAPLRCAKGAWVVLVQRFGGERVCW